MIELENFQTNLDVIDKYDLKKIKIGKGKVYTGSTEYINPQIKEDKHTSPLLATAVLGLDNTGAPLPENPKFCNIWTDIDAQEIYLNTKPTCYLILGKSGLGAFEVGEAMAKKYNVIHLCPKNILNDEMSQKSPTGKTWDFNMQHNKVCLFDKIITMLKIKLKSEVVQHRGYVISGLPLVTSSKKPLYYINSLHGEEAFLEMDEMLFEIIRNLKKKKKKPQDIAQSSKSSELGMGGEEDEEDKVEDEDEPSEGHAEEAVEEEEEKPAELPKFELDSCSNVIINKKPHYDSKVAVLFYQLNELFNLSLKPDIIIQISCPEMDLVTLKGNTYLNYKSSTKVKKPFISNYISDQRWPPKCDIEDYENPHAFTVFHPKYNFIPPLHYKEIVIEQICNYKTYVFPYLEKKLKDYDPKMVIEIDGRTSCNHMMYHVSERLILLNIQPVIIPKPLFLEELPENLEEFWASVAELDVIHNGDVNFQYYESPWFNRCPVELKLRRTVVGNPKYAVKLFKHVYLMSSLNHFISFNRNPRSYLKLKYLEPTCRVIVTGTKSSGKSMISECLSWIFDAPILDFNTIIETEKEKKYELVAKTILSEIIATIEDARILEWQRTEFERVAKLNEWCHSTLQLLKEYTVLFIEKIKIEEKIAIDKLNRHEREVVESNEEEKLIEEENKLIEEENKLIEEENKLIEEEYKLKEEDKSIAESVEEVDPALLMELDAVKLQLSFLPILDNIEECQNVLANQNITQYAPIDLATAINKPSIPAIGDEDVTIAISQYIEDNDMQKELEPNVEELVTETVRLITAIDTHHKKETKSEQFYGKYIIDGFPSDSEYWVILSDAKLFPDYTIALIENREIDEKLCQYYSNVYLYTKLYEEKILASKDPLIHTKLQTMKDSRLQEADIQVIVDNLINYTLDYIFITKNTSLEEIEPSDLTPFITSFTEAIEKFREDWDSIKLKLEEKSKSHIEVELENKTDVEIIEEVLLKLRKSYQRIATPIENEEPEDEEKDDPSTKDLLTHNDPKFLCETKTYCPIAYYDHDIMWEGNPEFSLKYDNKLHYFCKEEFLELFQKDITKYQFYNKPFKKLPRLRICVIGAMGTGTSSLSKHLAKELGVLHIDYSRIINEYIMPRHYRNVGRQYENMFVDEPIDDEGVIEFQTPEENDDLVNEMLGNEKEMIRMLNNHFERGGQILPALMHKMINQVWFDPNCQCGFVIDGYPKLPTDVEDMLSCYGIPDLVIELESNLETTIERNAPPMFKMWKSQQNEAKKAAAVSLVNERKLWLHTITKKIVTDLIIEEILDKIFSNPDTLLSQSVQSVIIDANPAGSANIDPFLFKAYNDLVEEYPEPKDTNVWEGNDEARERIENRIAGIYEIDDENVQSLKEILTENRIKIVTIDATKSLDKVIRHALSKISSTLKNRGESYLEQTFIVKPDVAEKLLARGFYFYSKFYRLCPVYIFENPLAIQNSYSIAKRKGSIFPVIHRSNIYFISSTDYVTKFRTNPLKYVTCDAIKSYFEYPLRIGVIGTPKSGQSTLAARLAEQYGLLCISRGKATRRVLENMHWTELAIQMTSCLREGKAINDDHFVRAIQTIAIDHRTVTYGFVLDGLPATPYQAKGLVLNGLFPNIIFDICSTKSRILENSQNEIYYDILKYLPPFPYPLIEIRYQNWVNRQHKIRKWVNDDYQNLFLLTGNNSKWHVFQEATDHLSLLTSKIHYYLCNVGKTIVRAIWISNDAFEARQSQYKKMCPVCFHKKIYKYMGTYFGGKTGVVHYNKKFYWICDEHMELVMEYPHCYLTYRNVELPELPAIISIVNLDDVYENGVCIVTYAEKLPAQTIKIGTNKFAASYAGNAYLFCSKECLTKFLCKPYLYKDIVVFKESKSFPKVLLKKLPNIGYLEQTLGNALTEACCSVNVIRPKYPGLSFETSALIYIALYLKTHNPCMDKRKLPMYLKALKVFEARCKLMLNVGLRLRSMDNPFSAYPKCLHTEPTLRPDDIEQKALCSIQLQKPLNIPQKTSNYIQLKKPLFPPLSQKRLTVSGRMKRN